MQRIATAAGAAQVERGLVLAALAFVVAGGLYSTLQLGDSVMMAAGDGPGLGYFALLFAMWWTMMMAMMLPSAAPAILVYASLNRKLAAKGGTAPLAAFIGGYATVWSAFCLAVVGLQILLGGAIRLDMMMATESAWVGGALLLAAGLYQLSPLKGACLSKCQSPLFFFARRWRAGPWGAWRMGLAHGVYCLGCCWVLMALLFYGGVMELRWIIGLALYVAAEKFIPAQNWLSRFTGLILIGWGILTVWQAGAGAS
ncbi:MAG: DUF2182 domain-containing protein [Alphaproteobacteria bacterium]|nr:DUF2182 domain-containing protein [Alphaproteobacteria bacterium]